MNNNNYPCSLSFPSPPHSSLQTYSFTFYIFSNFDFLFVYILDHKPKPETIEIYSIKIRENGTFKMMKMSLDDIWNNDLELRINNFADKEKHAHNEKDIRSQVKIKQILIICMIIIIDVVVVFV